MLTRIRIEAAAQTTEDVGHDLWAMAWASLLALVPPGEPTPDPFIHEEVITRLAPEEMMDGQVYKGRLVIGFPVDWDHAKGWFEIAAARKGKTPPMSYGQLSKHDQEELIDQWEREEAGDPPSATPATR